MIVRIGTRGSRLALKQAQDVADELTKVFPQHTFMLKEITTQGDRNQKTALHLMKDKGIFVKEIEEQLLNGQIDIAVHSMKDMPAALPKGLCLGPTPKAQDASDAVILKDAKQAFDTTFQGVLGTGSIRRIALIHEHFPHAKVKGIRGNIDTRIQKMQKEDYNGLILASAGLYRLGYERYISQKLDPTIFIPACTQGILALEIREDRHDIYELLSAIQDEKATLRQLGERTFLQCVHGGCDTLVGAYVHISDDTSSVTLYAMLGNKDGSCLVKGSKIGNRTQLPQMAQQLANELIRKCDHLE